VRVRFFPDAHWQRAGLVSTATGGVRLPAATRAGLAANVPGSAGGLAVLALAADHRAKRHDEELASSAEAGVGNRDGMDG
jgi:hypothetical protein